MLIWDNVCLSRIIGYNLAETIIRTPLVDQVYIQFFARSEIKAIN